MTKRLSLILLVLMFMTVGIAAVGAQDAPVELRIAWYNDGIEGEVLRELLDRFEADNPDIDVVIDTVSYNVIRDNLASQLEAGEGPDMARVTDLAGLSQYYLNIGPYVDAEYWRESFGSTLDPMQPADAEDGIYGMMTQLTITGPYVNATLFDRAGIELPGEGATWEEWVETATAVAEATDTPYAVAIDRSGHRVAGPAVSMGADYFDKATGEINLIGDEGFRETAQMIVSWHEEGITPPEIWVGSEASYADAVDSFAAGEVVLYMSGSWQIANMSERIGDFFDWRVVPNPCGPGGCTGMPGGAALVGIAGTQHPEEVARVMDYLAGEDVYREFAARTLFIPAHSGVAASGVDFLTDDEQARAAIGTFTAQVPRLEPTASALQAYPYNFIIWRETPNRLEQVIVGELTLDEAIERIQADVDQAIVEAAR
jgi:alpha-1,4-digalacturonate transport system substrate-binding protein